MRDQSKIRVARMALREVKPLFESELSLGKMRPTLVRSALQQAIQDMGEVRDVKTARRAIQSAQEALIEIWPTNHQWLTGYHHRENLEHGLQAMKG